MSTFYLKRGDTYPVLVAYLKNPDGTARNLTDSTVKLHISINGAIVTKTMTVGNALIGEVLYEWQAGDWQGAAAIIEGIHPIEIEERPSTGGRLTFPNTGFDLLVVSGDLGDA